MLQEIINEINTVKTINVNELDAKKTLVISIDMNNGFCKEGALSSDDVRKIIEPTKDIFEKLSDKTFKIIAYTDAHDEDSIEFKSYPIHCLKDSEESKIVDELIDYMDVVIQKASTNGFLAKNPLDIYKYVDTFLISGCCTDICIYQYAITLKTYLNEHNLDGRVIVAKNLVETFDAPYHNRELYHVMALKSLMNNGVEVVNIEG